MVKHIETPEHAELLARLKQVRAQAMEHVRIAQELAGERRRIMDEMLNEGFSQADLARELGVTRQAIQKMMAVGRAAEQEVARRAARAPDGQKDAGK